MTEFFECQNCCNRDVLDTHGRCQRCGSNQVISVHLISSGHTLDMLVDIFTTDELSTLFGLVMETVAKA